MATLAEIIKEKNRRLETKPTEFLTQVEKSQKAIFNELLVLLEKFNLKDGKIEISAANLAVVDEVIEGLKVVLYGSDYSDAVASFAKEFDKQGAINNDYFEKAFDDFKTPEIATEILARSKAATVESLIGGAVDQEFIKPAEKLLTDLVTSGAGFRESVQSIRDFVEGSEEANGKLLQYSKQIAHDSFAISDRSYTNAVSEELESEWFYYSGGEIPTTRCFCEERNGKHFHFKELEAFGRGEDLGECKAGDLGLWKGANIQTDAQTIFIYAGGYNCMHSILPVSIFDVPKEVVERNISNGNYEPTAFELEEFGL